ncbi:MAG TPA: hypothetical protein VGL69_07075 [Solirubrobacteraceae bacterium]|jgi:hypothetical protein
MGTSYEDKIKQQATPYLEDGERVLAAFIARPRGSGVASSAGLVGQAIGGRQLARQKDAAQDVGLRFVSPMALALTDRRLIVLSVSAPLALGKGGDVKEFVSGVPLSEVDSIESKRLLAGSVVVLTVGGMSFKLEAGAKSGAGRLIAEFENLR